jgi:hypothetical protein
MSESVGGLHGKVQEQYHQSKVQSFSSNTSITFMKYSLGHMFCPQLAPHQALYMYRSFILQYILGSQTVL